MCVCLCFFSAIFASFSVGVYNFDLAGWLTHNNNGRCIGCVFFYCSLAHSLHTISVFDFAVDNLHTCFTAYVCMCVCQDDDNRAI